MSDVSIELATLEDIGNAIRAKDGTTESIPVTDLASRVEALGGENKLPQFIDGTITEITAEDLGDITELGEFAFAGRRQLAKLEIPNSVTTIKKYAFQDTTALKEIFIPSTVRTFEMYSFSNNKLERIYIDNLSAWCSANIDGNTGFYKNNADLYLNDEPLTIFNAPEDLTQIKNHSFGNCPTLERVNIGENIENIQYGAFYYCSNITEINLSEGLETIGQLAFAGTNIEELVIPDSVTNVTVYAFNVCTNLKSVHIGSGITTLSNIFSGCTSLTSLTIPVTVRKIESSALSNLGTTTNKPTFTFLRTTPPTISRSTFNTSYLEKIVVPVGCGEAYKTATNWANFADYIEEATE